MMQNSSTFQWQHECILFLRAYVEMYPEREWELVARMAEGRFDKDLADQEFRHKFFMGFQWKPCAGGHTGTLLKDVMDLCVPNGKRLRSENIQWWERLIARLHSCIGGVITISGRRLLGWTARVRNDSDDDCRECDDGAGSGDEASGSGTRS
jgi:hypothetical protein